MAFPTTPVLDPFNTGATQNLTARTGWGASVLVTADATFATDGTPTTAVLASGAGSNYWNTSVVDSESYCKLVSFSAGSNELELPARITATGASPTYYAVNLGHSSLNDFEIIKIVAGTRTLIGSTITQVISNGDSIGISVIGSQVTSYYKSGAGAWTQMDTVSDSSITGSGFLGGIRAMFFGSVTIDDFGGGAPVVGNNSARMIRDSDRNALVF